MIRLLKTNNKETILSVAREEKYITHKGTKMRILKDFLLETMQMRRQWATLASLTGLKGKNYQPRIFHPGKYLSKIKVNIGFQTYKNYKQSSPVDLWYKNC